MKLNAALAVVLFASAAHATEWWISWTGDDYPDNEGWTRAVSTPPPQRWLEDGKLFIDSRAAWGMSDIYGQYRPGMMTLAPGETICVRWRARVDETIPAGREDAGVEIDADDQWSVILSFGADSISSVYEPDKWAHFVPGVFHDFSFQTDNMRTYRLNIDGVPTLEGTFFESLFYWPGVGFGDISTGRSLAEWDVVECGIVPEPSGLLFMGALCACWPLKRSAAAE